MELHQGVVKNALSNSLDFLDQFRDKFGEAYEAVEKQIDKTPWGYKLKKHSVNLCDLNLFLKLEIVQIRLIFY